MLKTLLKKQIMETFALSFPGRNKLKKGNKEKKGSVFGIILVSILAIILVVLFISIFLPVAFSLSDALVQNGLSWLYYSLMGLIGVFLGVIGSVYSTSACLYNSKDNDLLLSMPIKPSQIIFSRLFGVYVMGLIYESVVMIPTIAVSFINGFASVSSVIFSVRLKRGKNIVSVILSLLVIVCYYYIYFNASEILKYIAANGGTIGGKIKLYAYPMYLFGNACNGNFVSMLLICAIIILVFAAVYLLLSKTFLGIATKKIGAKRSRLNRKQIRSQSLSGALLKKEFRLFFSNFTYMTNCALGTILIPILGILGIVFKPDIIQFMASAELDLETFMGLYLIAFYILCALNTVTSPSISLEGKNIWVLQTLPVDAKEIFNAKKAMHYILTIPPMVFLTACSAYVFDISILTAVLMALCAAALVMLIASVGLAVNIKKPILNWTNEVVPIKQSLWTIIPMVVGWAGAILLGIGSVLATFFIPLDIYLISAAVLLFALAALVNLWINKRGTKIFGTL